MRVGVKGRVREGVRVRVGDKGVTQIFGNK